MYVIIKTMNELTCCFTGHRANKLPWGFNEKDPSCVKLKKRVEMEITNLYGRGVRHFICGMANGCDMYCAESVLQLRQRYPDITLEAAIPHKKQSEKYPSEQKRMYEEILTRCDKITYVHEFYSPACMMDRNKYMVNNSDIVLAIYNGTAGGTRNTILYAMRSGKHLIKIEL